MEKLALMALISAFGMFVGLHAMNPIPTENDPFTPQDHFMIAVMDHDTPRLTSLFYHPLVDVNAYAGLYNPLSYAVQHLDQEMVTLLLTHKMLDPNAKGVEGNTVLHWLALYSWLYGDDRSYAIYALLEHDTRIRFNIPNDDGVTVEDLAGVLYKWGIVNIGYARPYQDFGSHTRKIRTSTNCPEQKVQKSREHYERECLKVKVQEALSKMRLREDAGFGQMFAVIEKEIISLDPQDLFVTAVLHRNVARVKRLLNSSEIEINTLYLGRSVVSHAALHLDYDMVEVLLSNKDLDPNIQELHGNTVLHWLFLWACAYPDSRYLWLIDLLLNDTRIDFNLANDQGKTVKDLLKMLIDTVPAVQLKPLQNLWRIWDLVR